MHAITATYDAATDTLTFAPLKGVSKLAGTVSSTGKSLNLGMLSEKITDKSGRQVRVNGTVYTPNPANAAK